MEQNETNWPRYFVSYRLKMCSSPVSVKFFFILNPSYFLVFNPTVKPKELESEGDLVRISLTTKIRASQMVHFCPASDDNFVPREWYTAGD